MKSYRCPKCDVSSTAAAWDAKTRAHYGGDCLKISEYYAENGFYDCPSCEEEWIAHSEITEADPFDAIYVILVDGVPHLKDHAIRTYQTRERAVKEAHALYWLRDRRIETAVFAVNAIQALK